jgi:hypothetical protein
MGPESRRNQGRATTMGSALRRLSWRQGGLRFSASPSCSLSVTEVVEESATLSPPPGGSRRQVVPPHIAQPFKSSTATAYRIKRHRHLNRVSRAPPPIKSRSQGICVEPNGFSDQIQRSAGLSYLPCMRNRSHRLSPWAH